jgi:hypothetical protein
VEIQRRIIKFITRTNWILLFAASIGGFFLLSSGFAMGIFLGGLLVTINFHLLSRTLKKAFSQPHYFSHKVVLFKYYLRFLASGVIIFILISKQMVDPLGLILGLSVVVGSIILAALRELKKLIFKEAV